MILFAIIAAAGLVFIGKGLYVYAKAELAQVLLETSFENSLKQSGSGQPWPWADFTTEARLGSARLGVSDIVLSDARGEALAFGPTHLAGTPFPGQQGTAVIAAHRDTHFRWLKDLLPGDRVDITGRDGTTLYFEVRAARIAQSDSSGIDADRHGRWVALATCWPFDSTSQGSLRYIIEAEMIEAPATNGTLALAR